MSDTPQYLREFPDFEPLEFDPQQLPVPLHDESWHNDSCPRFVSLAPGVEEDGKPYLALWLDYKDPHRSEQGVDGYHRFVLEEAVYYGMEETTILATNDFDELVAFMAKYKEQHNM
jgi:hypothetical protein